MRNKTTELPPKPYRTFPLFAHRNGSWTKKIAGVHTRFGAWRWPDQAQYELSWREALANYEGYLERVARGQAIVDNPRSIRMKTLCDLFLGPQHARAESGEIKHRSFAELRQIVTEFRDIVGQRTTVGELERQPDPIRDYVQAIDGRFGWCAFNKRIKLVRSLWNWASDRNGPLQGRAFAWTSLLVERPVKLFRRQRRKEREEGRAVTFAPDEVRALIDYAPSPLRAMIMLGYFAAYGNTDMGELPDAALKVTSKPTELFLRGRREQIPAGWGTLFFPRPKTELDRYALVPPLVVEAVQRARTARAWPADPQWKNRMFLTAGGERVCYEVTKFDPAGLIEKVDVVDNVGQPWRRLVQRLGRCEEHGWQVRVPFSRERDARGKPVLRCPTCNAVMLPMQMRGFYALRHTATTFAAGSGASDDTRKVFEGHGDRSNPTRQTYYLDPTQLHDLYLIARELLARVGLDDITGTASLAPAPETSQSAAVA